MNEKILSKMKKLLAMSQDSTSENEALLATKRLHTLLAKHNISLVDVKDHGTEKIDEESFESIDWPWRRYVARSIAELYFCEMYYRKTRKNYASYFFVGTPLNRQYAISMTNIIINSIERQAKVECKIYHSKIVSSFITSFKTAAGRRIWSRCRELIEQSKKGELKDEEGNTLPILASVYDQHKNRNAEFMDGIKLKDKKTSTRSKSQAGHDAGKIAGDRVPLNTGVQRDSAPKAIGRE